MKIKLNDLWQFQGVEIHIKEPIPFDEIKPGFYRFIERDSMDSSLMLLSKQGNLVYLTEYTDEDEIFVNNNDLLERLTAVVDGYTILVFGLIKDGWTETDDPRAGLNLADYNNKLKEYIKLLKLVTGSE